MTARREVLLRCLMRSLPVHLSLATVAAAQPVLQLYGDNLAVFTAADMEGWSVLAFMATAILGPPLFLTAAESAVAAARPSWARGAHLGAVGIGVWTVVLLVTRSAPLGPWPVALCLTAATAAGLVWGYARLRAVGQWLTWMSPIAVAVGVLFAMAAREVIWVPEVDAVEVEVVDTTVPETVTPPADVSVLWFVLDEFSVSSLLGSDGEINAERFPGFAELASVSTWYRNNLTVSKDTIEAVPALLTGRYARMGRAPTLATYPDNLFTITSGVLEMDVNETITRLCPRDLCRFQAVSGGDDIANPDLPSTTAPPEPEPEPKGPGFGAFLRDAAVVLGHKLLPDGLRDRLPPIDEGWGGFGGGDGYGTDSEVYGEYAEYDSEYYGDSEDDGSAEADDGGDAVTVDTIVDENAGDRDRDDQVARFRNVVNRAARAAAPTLHFSHLMIPHKPWILTPDLRTYDWQGQYLRAGKNPDEVDQVHLEYGAYLYQVAAVDTLVAEMLEQLRRSANWDRTMIIVTSDHGQTFEPGLNKRKVLYKNRPESFDDVFRTPLFIKYPDQRAGRIDDCPVMSVDVLPTVLAAKGLSVAVDFDGVNLLETPCPVRPSRTVKYAATSAEMSGGLADLLARVGRLSEFVDHDGDASAIAATGPYASLLGRNVGATAGETPIASYTIDQARQFARISGAELDEVPAEISGRVVLSKDVPAGTWVAVTIDGRVAGFLGEVTGARAGDRVSFRSLIDFAQLVPGRRDVGLVVLSGPVSAPTAVRVT